MPKYPHKPQRTRSNCWYYYTKCEVGGKCRLCGREVRSSGCTTNLLNHLKRNHKEQFNGTIPVPEDVEAVSFLDSGNEEEHVEDSRTSNDNSKNLPTPKKHHQIVENNYSRTIPYQTEGGQTVIWLQATPDEQTSSLEPQVTIVELSAPEHSDTHPDSPQKEHAEDSGTHNDNSKNSSTSEKPHLIVENNHSRHIAYQTEGGETVIWVQAASEEQNGSFHPQIAVVEHSVPENSEHSDSHPGETILSTGEIVTNAPVSSTEGHTAVSQAHPPVKSVHNDTKKKPLKLSRTSSSSVPIWTSSPVKVARTNLISGNTEAGGEDVYDKFGKYLASLLRNLSSKKTACRLQKEIVWLVLQEQIRTEDT